MTTLVILTVLEIVVLIAGLVDVLDPRADQLGVGHDAVHELRGAFELGPDPVQQRARPVQVEGQAGDERDDDEDGQDDQHGHDLTFPRTRPRNR